MHFSPAFCYSLSLVTVHIFLSILFSDIPSLCFSVNARKQVSHQYKTVGRIIVLYLNLYAFRIKTADGKTKDSELNDSKCYNNRSNQYSSYKPILYLILFESPSELSEQNAKMQRMRMETLSSLVRITHL